MLKGAIHKISFEKFGKIVFLIAICLFCLQNQIFQTILKLQTGPGLRCTDVLLERKGEPLMNREKGSVKAAPNRWFVFGILTMSGGIAFKLSSIKDMAVSRAI